MVKPKEQCVQLTPFLRGWEVLQVRGLWRTSAYGGFLLSGLVMFYGLQMLGEISGGHALIKHVEIIKGKVSDQDLQDQILNTKETYFPQKNREQGRRDKDRR